MPARVLYDVSQLGLPWYLPPGHSYGLARMTAQLLPRLLRADDLEAAAVALQQPVECWWTVQRDFPDLLPRLQITAPGRFESATIDHLARHYHGEPRPAPWPRLVRKARRAADRRRRTRDPVLRQALADARLLHREIGIDFDPPADLATLVTVHDLIPIRHPEWGGDGVALAERLRRAEVQGAHFICVSEHVRADLIDFLGLAAERVFVLRQAADTEVFHAIDDPEQIAAARENYRLPPEGDYLFSLSSFTPRKNLAGAIRAFASVLASGEAHDDLHLVLAGYLDTTDRAAIESLLPDDAIRRRVHLIGGVDDADLAALLSGALGFVFLSRAEGFGLPPLEAMHCGTPVICSSSTSLPEVVGDAALSVAPDDLDAAAEALRRIASDADLRHDLSARGLDRATQFSWDRCADDVRAAYRAIL